MTTLTTDPFVHIALDFLTWAYGPLVKQRFVWRMSNGERAGQAFMNVLRDFDEPGYERLTGSLADPFYKDTNLPNALDLLARK